MSSEVSYLQSERHRELIGSCIEDVRVDGGLVYLEVTHRGTDDEACTLLVRAVETEWLHEKPLSGEANQ
jgi:hypothetical protein